MLELRLPWDSDSDENYRIVNRRAELFSLFYLFLLVDYPLLCRLFQIWEQQQFAWANPSNGDIRLGLGDCSILRDYHASLALVAVYKRDNSDRLFSRSIPHPSLAGSARLSR
jgi:hypothetical protein